MKVAPVVAPSSRLELPGGWACLAAGSEGDALLVTPGVVGFDGPETELEGVPVRVVERSRAAARRLRVLVPWLRPRPLGTSSSFGFGDRIGCATPGHVAALVSSSSRLAPVFAQQSPRELERTGRTFDDVLDAATWGTLAAGWRTGYGADADHLRTADELRNAVSAGFTMFTFDPSASVDVDAAQFSGAELDRRVRDLPWHDLEDDWDAMRRRHAPVDAPGRASDTADVARAAAVYGRALLHVLGLWRELQAHGAQEYDVEVSIDETPLPTTPFEHAFVALELARLGVRVTSIAPRLPGRWPKGTDVAGDPHEIAAAASAHATTAARCGGHKLSIHSGSDKFSAYPALAAAGGPLHVKTSGTSYLEALRIVAQVEPSTFRSLADVAARCFEHDRRSYALEPDAAVPDLSRLADEELPGVLDVPGPRQALHVTFGSVLSDPVLGPLVRACLARTADTYDAALERHLGRHLVLLETA